MFANVSQMADEGSERPASSAVGKEMRVIFMVLSIPTSWRFDGQA